MELKSILQILAASQNGRNLIYYSFNFTPFHQNLQEIHRLLQEKKQTVGQVYALLETFANLENTSDQNMGFFQFLKSRLSIID